MTAPAPSALPKFVCNCHKHPVRCNMCCDCLAAPLAPEAVAVLEAVETWQAEINDRNLYDVNHTESRLDDVVTAWIAAGRPGLP